MIKLRPLMFVGTGSDVGKSIINTGFCRILKQDGYQPAPFKAQNMSLNSFATPEGLEIGRAQAVQAEACGLACHTDMNPVLLKPTNDKSSQVVLNGKPIGTQTAVEYFMGNNKHALFEEAKSAFHRLNQKYNPVVLEGAGSISELNLKTRDITNMRMAVEANAVTYLIADIDKGGVFASVYGSIQLLDENERKQIKGIIINKFRGDIKLFEDGKKIIEDLTGKPVIGILPYFKDIHIEEEDSVSLGKKSKTSSKEKINCAVVILPRMANFTDFDVLEHDPRVHLFYTNNPLEIETADIIILPGSKNTISDLQELKQNGVALSIVKAHKNGKKVIGICGGYQMMGEKISDPLQIEGNIENIAGLGILPIETTITNEKLTEQCAFKFRDSNQDCFGYEIHMGETIAVQNNIPLCILSNGKTDGYFLNQNCWGSYIHGILDNKIVIQHLLSGFNLEQESDFNYQEFKENQYDKLADLIRENIDMDLFYAHLKED
ncbi:cobyric acid synthase [Labilibaculum sp. A4]|uniref:cobyric acid synthase n=1 Tax=Labilibaculum euxinus TaxID=2686357 RepID=UPI000F62513D|nr:cobyric acid synthase [Labilibaculum euxinus]MDQ1771303.1 cobyric acid synthase [Labilibaculum euxinus]MWN77090.1 cobyric acid synthase [Labilibaculum euxinus]